MIYVKINDNGIIENFETTVSDSIKYETVKFQFPLKWKEYSKTVVFRNNNSILNVVLDMENDLCISENECYIPYEVLKPPFFTISVFGVLGDSRVTSSKAEIKVIESGYAKGDKPSAPTPTEYEQLLNLANQTKQIAQSVRDDADNGLFKGNDAICDQSYNPTSENAQSGKAVAEAISTKADKATTLAGYGITDGITSDEATPISEIETVVDGYSQNNDRTSQPYWAPFILDEATHGHTKYKNKNIVAIKLDVSQIGTLSIGRIKTIDYNSETFNEELIVERISLNIENTGEQTINLPTAIVVNDDEDLFIGHTTDTAKIKYGNTEKDQGFFYKTNGGISFVNQSVSLGVSVFASSYAEIEFENDSLYRGKKLSILGDSISTFSGYISEGNATWYPTQSITDVEQTWWHKVLDKLEMSLDTNNSCSGSCVSYIRNSRPTGITRCENLGNPDVIIVWMGINDFVYAGRELGIFNGISSIPDGSDNMDFCSAYAVMLNKILTTYPTAEVLVCTLPETDFSAIGTASTYPKFNKNGNTVTEYNNAIKQIANAFSIDVIELDKSGITWETLADYTDDKLHLNIAGHDKIANKVIETLMPKVEILKKGANKILPITVGKAVVMQNGKNLEQVIDDLNNKSNGINLSVDQTYNPESENAQSGKAVAEAIGSLNNQYELIEKIIVGYSVLTSKPTDWDSNFAAYYKNTGTLREPVYTALTELEEWESGKYFERSDDIIGEIQRRTEPDGSNFSYKSIYFYSPNLQATATAWLRVTLFNNNNLAYADQIMTEAFANMFGTSAKTFHFAITPNGASAADGVVNTGFMKNANSYSSYIGILKRNNNSPTEIKGWKFGVTDPAVSVMKSGMELYIYGVRV